MRYGEVRNGLDNVLNEMFIDPNEDTLHKREGDDTRAPRLTLRMINKLKKIRATNELEDYKKESILGLMYGQPEEDDSDF